MRDLIVYSNTGAKRYIGELAWFELVPKLRELGIEPLKAPKANRLYIKPLSPWTRKVKTSSDTHIIRLA